MAETSHTSAAATSSSSSSSTILSTSETSTTKAILTTQKNSAVLSVELVTTRPPTSATTSPIIDGDNSDHNQVVIGETSGETSSTVASTTSTSYRSCHLVSFQPITRIPLVQSDQTLPGGDDTSSADNIDDGGESDSNGQSSASQPQPQQQQQVPQLPPQPPERAIGPFQLSFEAGGYIAIKHLNERNNSIISNLNELLDGNSSGGGEKCDIYFTYEMTDTQVNPLVAGRDLQDVTIRKAEDSLTRQPPFPAAIIETLRAKHDNTTNWSTIQEDNSDSSSYSSSNPTNTLHPLPIGIIGGAASSISEALAILGGVYSLPQISGTSSATSLDDKERAPYFSRLYPTVDSDANALMILYKYKWNVTHFGCIYSRDAYGVSYGEAVVRQAKLYGVTVYAIAYEINNYQSLYDALSYLKSIEVKYFFGIFHFESYKSAFQISYDLNIMGKPRHGRESSSEDNNAVDNDDGTSTTNTWLLSDNNSELTTKDFTLDVKTEYDIGQAIHGVGVLLTDFQQHPVLDQILAEDFKYDSQLQADFVAAHVSCLL